MSLPAPSSPLLVLAPTAAAAELATLDGRKLTGEIVAITGNELTFKSPAGEEKFLVTTHPLGHDRPGAEAVRGRQEAHDRRTDRRLAIPLPESIVIKGETVEMKLLGRRSPRTISVPMRPAVFAVNREAGDLKLEQDFRDHASAAAGGTTCGSPSDR